MCADCWTHMSLCRKRPRGGIPRIVGWLKNYSAARFLWTWWKWHSCWVRHDGWLAIPSGLCRRFAAWHIFFPSSKKFSLNRLHPVTSSICDCFISSPYRNIVDEQGCEQHLKLRTRIVPLGIILTDSFDDLSRTVQR